MYGGRWAAGVYKGCGKWMRGGAVWVQVHGAKQSSIWVLCSLLLHLVMKTEIPSSFEQDGTRASSVRNPSMVGRFPSKNPPREQCFRKLLAVISLGEVVLHCSDGLEHLISSLARPMAIPLALMEP